MPDHFGDQLAPVPAMMAALDATTDAAHRRARVRQRLQAPGRAGQGAGDDGRALRRPRGDRPRRRLDDQRLRAGRHAPTTRPGVRIDRFVEGLHIISEAMRARRVLVRGHALHDHRTTTVCRSRCRPCRRCSSVAAASGCSASPPARPTSSASTRACTPAWSAPRRSATMTADAVDEKVAIVRAAAGDRFDEIEMNIRVVPGQRHRRRRRRPRAARRRRSACGDRDARDVAVRADRSPDELVERLLARRERWGFSYVIVGPEDVDSFAPVVAELAGQVTVTASRCAAQG